MNEQNRGTKRTRWKKILIFTLFSMGLTCAYFLYFPMAPSSFSLQKPCPFCNPTIIQNQSFYEDDLVLALYTHKPVCDGHCLIIPKRHVERFDLLTEAEIAHIGQVIKKVHMAAMKAFGTSPYLLLQKNGREVGQSVPHLHFHYIPRKEGDNSAIRFILLKLFFAPFQSPMDARELQEAVEKMKEAINKI